MPTVTALTNTAAQSSLFGKGTSWSSVNQCALVDNSSGTCDIPNLGFSNTVEVGVQLPDIPEKAFLKGITCVFTCKRAGTNSVGVAPQLYSVTLLDEKSSGGGSVIATTKTNLGKDLKPSSYSDILVGSSTDLWNTGFNVPDQLPSKLTVAVQFAGSRSGGVAEIVSLDGITVLFDWDFYNEFIPKLGKQ